MTGTNHVGWSWAVASAALTWVDVAPICWSPEPRAKALVTREPSIPTCTMGACVVKGAPPAPVMAARVAHLTVVVTVSPGPSWGMMERGVHWISHVPEASLSCRCE